MTASFAPAASKNSKSIVVSVEGMMCTACENTVEQALTALEGVHEAHADTASKTAHITYSAPCTLADIHGAIEKAGYTIAVPTRSSRTNLLAVVVIVAGLMVIAHQLGLGAIFQAVPLVDAEETGFVALFLLGVATSVHCVAMCGGINLAQSISAVEKAPSSTAPSRRRTWGHCGLSSLAYNAGRLASYTAVGALLGLLGSALVIAVPVKGAVASLAGIAMVVMGLSFALGVSPFRKLEPLLPRQLARRMAALARGFRSRGPFALGLANGFMPCGPLQAMQLYAVSTGSPVEGALSLFFFCLGTIPLVLVVGIAASALKSQARRLMMQAGGILLVAFGLFMAGNGLALSGLNLPATPTVSLAATGTEAPEGVQVAAVQGDAQYLTTHVQPGSYEDVQVKADIPVTWTFIAEEAALNGCNSEILITPFDIDLPLTAGSNTVTFTPTEPGTYTYSCWMGMIRNTITVV
ncbi:sulfite exporter TauE/SafE family protein [Adlercreutzia equolifaciens]|uniref:urease accessory protein UreH domain-containing protein n=1 Tax=Adlercreutzia equolifaciens TaxID=446660 RepID=UPI0023AF0155|nr:sulfite exporter TauE/SafE family protein [Adlercreutzia equolifaciens]MDE8702924.1 sulfite exporter TauE/SafE family protein [Adlercreutzia equolifaciens]